MLILRLSLICLLPSSWGETEDELKAACVLGGKALVTV